MIFKGKISDSDLNKYSNARKLMEYKLVVKKFSIDFFMISVGILGAGFGLKGFLLPNNFLDGGATGISLMIAELMTRTTPLRDCGEPSNVTRTPIGS